MKYFLFLNFAAHFFSYTFPVQIYVISPNFDIALFILSLYSSTFHTKEGNPIPVLVKNVRLGPWQWIWGFLRVKDTTNLSPLPFTSSSYYVLLGRKFYLIK